MSDSRIISQRQAYTWMQEDPKTLVLDVRTESEYKTGYIPGAKLLPVDEVESRAESFLPDKEVRILIYCRSGIRSQTALKILTEKGYTRVYDFGGILDWPYERA